MNVAERVAYAAVEGRSVEWLRRNGYLGQPSEVRKGRFAPFGSPLMSNVSLLKNREVSMRGALAALLLLIAAPGAFACRGPFSAAYQIHLRVEHQVYLGKVLSVEERLVRSGPDQWSEHVATLQVLHAWRKNPPATITVRGLGMNVGNVERCVDMVAPKEGEEWLVVARPVLNGMLEAERLMSLNMAMADGSTGLAVVKKKLGSGYSRNKQDQANKSLEPTR